MRVVRRDAGGVGKEGRRIVTRGPGNHYEPWDLTVGRMHSPGRTSSRGVTCLDPHLMHSGALLRMESKGAREEAGRARRR